MAEEVLKQEINATRGSFHIRGIITSLDKEQEIESKTSKGNTMRRIVFNVDTAEGHSHRMQLMAYQGEKVYFSCTKVDDKGNRTNIVEEVKWNDRQKFNKEGFLPIDRVSFHCGMKKDDDGKESRATVSMLTFDAIPEILKEFSVGDSVNINGTLQIEEYTMQNGNTGKAVRMIPTRMFHTTEDVDFNADDFSEVANFTQVILMDEIEFTGTKEATITGLVIGNRRMGRQDFIYREDPAVPDVKFSEYEDLLRVLKNEKKYVCAKVWGQMINGASKQEEEVEYIVIKGVRVPKKVNPMERRGGNGFIREFLITGIDLENLDFESYTEENVQQFIDTFIRAKEEFGESTSTSSADDFAF